MTAVKLSSTNRANKQQLLSWCPVTHVMDRIGARWKPIIIFNLVDGMKRYSELKKAIPGITEKMLIQHLKELETDGLVSRKALPVVPPHVEYRLTKLGRELTPVFEAMVKWAHKHRNA
jgi:DNA-binding HxlR family transcriptional regulator